MSSWEVKTRFDSQLSRMNCQMFSTGLSSGERYGKVTSAWRSHRPEPRRRDRSGRDGHGTCPPCRRSIVPLSWPWKSSRKCAEIRKGSGQYIVLTSLFWTRPFDKVQRSVKGAHSEDCAVKGVNSGSEGIVTVKWPPRRDTQSPRRRPWYCDDGCGGTQQPLPNCFVLVRPQWMPLMNWRSNARV